MFTLPVFAQQPPEPEKEKKRRTRVCAIEDETKVNSPDNPSTSRVLKPGYCVDCWMGIGCGAPFLAGGLLALIGGTAAGAGLVGIAGIFGGLFGTGVLGGGGGGNGNPPGGPPPIVLPTILPGPSPAPTQPGVSPFL